MFPASDRPRLYGLPPGADFAQSFVAGVLARMADKPPEAMAAVTIYLNTAKMRERVRAAFRAHGPMLLPRLKLLSELDADPSLDLPEAQPALRRRLELMRLVRELMAREADFAPGTAAIDLADSLADLMDEMAAEGVPPEALEDPGLAEDHAVHWERSLRFLRIIAPFFADGGTAAGAAARQRRAAELLIERWRDGVPQSPVIVAGSTGSRGATALFMQAVARLPQGAIVLPGFDGFMTAAAWESLTRARVPNEDHPQFRFAKLFGTLGMRPSEVGLWHGAAPDPARNRLLSLALRPAPVTDQWLSEGQALLPLDGAAEGVSLIEAPTPRTEALAIALALREAAERGVRAALVTPDRTLARRVTAQLDRWRIEPDDSAGRPLHLSAPGRLLRHVAGLFGRRVTGEALLTLLKHPLAATGGTDRGDHLRFTRELELHLRRKGPAFPAGADLLAWAALEEEPARTGWAMWLADCLSALPEASERPLSAWLETVLSLSEALAAGPGGVPEASELWREAAGEAAAGLMAGLRAEADAEVSLSAADFADLLTRLLQAETVRPTHAASRLITVEGTREAREIQADLVVLGGLNEEIWPAAVPPDPWLSRQMRLKAGLLLPERQVGLSAHDFQIAAAAPQVILSRAMRDDEAETIASRWLDRLVNLMGGLEGEGGALADMRARGQRWLALTRAVEAREAVPSARRPSPRPPPEARPKELPVTAIARLIRDPYAIYAREILRLKPLDPLLAEPDARMRGQILHRIVETFVQTRPEGEGPQAAKERFLALTDTVLAAEVQWPAARALWQARMARIADWFVESEAGRQAMGAPVLLEKAGGVGLPGLDFRLTARPDRIDMLADGALQIIDYKSGKPPSPQQRRQFEKQMPLEAAMAERGAFAATGPRPVAGATFIRLGGTGEEQAISRDDLDPDGEWARLQALIAAYARPTKGYSARRAPFMKDDPGDYDHLARFGEWQMSDVPVPEDVGGGSNDP
ncbi:double-strand break repair protein AddB [Frigidibacter sp. RF13]|uniref:double-strand break repair protein AddB n=1 Tax=Frigidibacter sp. RF13 TaxID=2997340 RepID=UPI0022716589|nr:double-strand break repair protein AddB [Frigidibacter sp. RF13]MCY1126633.1 double-strand break repair protein AddB [Frigidibacter sp. RF13]